MRAGATPFCTGATVWRAGAPERGEEADACVWGLTAPRIAVSEREASRRTIVHTPDRDIRGTFHPCRRPPALSVAF